MAAQSLTHQAADSTGPHGQHSLTGPAMLHPLGSCQQLGPGKGGWAGDLFMAHPRHAENFHGPPKLHGCAIMY